VGRYYAAHIRDEILTRIRKLKGSGFSPRETVKTFSPHFSPRLVRLISDPAAAHSFQEEQLARSRPRVPHRCVVAVPQHDRRRFDARPATHEVLDVDVFERVDFQSADVKLWLFRIAKGSHSRGGLMSDDQTFVPVKPVAHRRAANGGRECDIFLDLNA
jgi:hypothetical protein